MVRREGVRSTSWAKRGSQDWVKRLRAMTHEDVYWGDQHVRLTRDGDGELVAVDIWYRLTDGYIRVEDPEAFKERNAFVAGELPE